MLCLSKSFEFSASHRLGRNAWDEEKNLQVFGKCANKRGHGHNYKLEVVVSGTPDSETGMIIDASRLDDIVQEVIVMQVDHKHLNEDVPWLSEINPTSELIVSAFWDRLAPAIVKEGPNVELEKLVLYETSRIYASRTKDQ